jgi:hypothetical protein
MRAILVAGILAFASLAAFGAEQGIATIDFVDGPARVTRDGAPLSNPGIGDEIYDGDLIATGNGATLTLSLAKATGMSGTIKLSPNTSLYLSVDSLKGERQSQAELIGGQVGLKLKKLGGAPGFTVATETAVCAVRGTEFEVLASSAGSILVACSEGEVSCASEGVETSAVPGQAVEKQEGAKLARRAVAAADYEDFKAKWLAGEAAAFKKNAPKAARRIAARYLDLSERLAANHEKIAADGALKAWLEEEKKGAPSSISDKELDRRLAETGPLLQESRSILAAMERIAARVGALEGIVAGDRAVMASKVRAGVTVADFFKRFEVAKDRDQQRIVVLRKALKLYRRAMAEREAMGGSSSK